MRLGDVIFKVAKKYTYLGDIAFHVARKYLGNDIMNSTALTRSSLRVGQRLVNLTAVNKLLAILCEELRSVIT